MIRVGLTGTVAAGKSTVGGLFERWGAQRVDADVLAREAVEPGSDGLHRIREIWGEDVLTTDGSLDRAALRRRVFPDAEARRQLEDIVHAEVRRLRDLWREAMTERGANILIEEIPLLYETGLGGGYDAIVVVDALIEVRAERARADRGWSLEDFEHVEASQMVPEEKRARADYVIWNDGDPEALERASREVWDSLLGIDATGGSS